MSAEAVAARYAQALFELGVEMGNLPALTDEIRRVGETYEGSDELRAVLGNPIVDAASRQAILRDVLARLGVGPVVTNTLGLLAERRRLTVLPYLSRSLQRLADERAGVVRATVTSATPLADGYVDELRQQLETSLGKRVQLEREVDPTLLGGLITRIGDRVIDGSLRTRLDRLRQTMLTGQATLQVRPPFPTRFDVR
ncbi:MAG: ATP synthase F1 subunit delta [Myxococcales bacterium]|nr:MAG: ATP synthase F1 subunit delta [Myxococcales bacterium]